MNSRHQNEFNEIEFDPSSGNVYYISSAGMEGPYTFETISKLVREGYIMPNTQVCYDSKNWIDFSQSELVDVVDSIINHMNVTDGVRSSSSSSSSSNTSSSSSTTSSSSNTTSSGTSSSTSSRSSSSSSTSSSRSSIMAGSEGWLFPGNSAGSSRTSSNNIASYSKLTSKHIWVEDYKVPENVWTPAVVMSIERNRVNASVLETRESITVDIGDSTLFYCNDDSIGEAENAHSLSHLEHIHRPGVLNRLNILFNNGERFASIGATALVTLGISPNVLALNSKHPLAYFYGVHGSIENANRGEVSSIEKHLHFLNSVAHPWSIAEKAFQFLRIMMTSQSIVFKGHLGSGKTSTAQCILAYLLERNLLLPVSPFHEKTPIVQALKGLPDMQSRMNATMVVLNAFGHSLKYQSANTSKFGNIVKLFYEHVIDTGRPSEARDPPILVGANVNCLLFAKNHVASNAIFERNFHVFYELLAAKKSSIYSSLKSYGLSQPGLYRLLVPADGTGAYVPGDPEYEEFNFNSLCEAFLCVGISGEDISSIFQVLIGILHLGNVEFTEVVDTATGQVFVSFEDERPLIMAAKVLFLDPSVLSTYLTCDKEVNYTLQQSIFVRDQLCKQVYHALFQRLVQLCNKCLGASATQAELQAKPCISLVDLPALVGDPVNGYETFLVNWTSEKLNHTLYEQCFGRFMSFYVNEQADDAHRFQSARQILFANHNEILDLIENPQWGIVSVLERTCSSAGNDDVFVLSLNYSDKISHHARYKSVIAAHGKGFSSFIVHHFEDQIEYSTSVDNMGCSWTESNRSKPSKDLIRLCESSQLPELIAIAGCMRSENAQLSKKSKKSNGSPDAPDSHNAGHFRKTLDSLHKLLLETTCYRVNCLFTTDAKDAMIFDRQVVTQQIGELHLAEMAKTFSCREHAVVPFNGILQPIQTLLNNCFADFIVEQPENVIVSCLLYAVELPEDAYVVDEKKGMVYLNVKYVPMVMKALTGCVSGSQHEVEFKAKVEDAINQFHTCMRVVWKCKKNVRHLLKCVEHAKGTTSKIQDLCKKGFELRALTSGNITLSKRDTNVLEVNAQAEHELSQLHPQRKAIMACIGKCEDLEKRLGFYAKHCWTSLADEIGKQFRLSYVEANKGLSVMSRALVKTLKLLLNVESLQSEVAAVIQAVEKEGALLLLEDQDVDNSVNGNTETESAVHAAVIDERTAANSTSPIDANPLQQPNNADKSVKTELAMASKSTPESPMVSSRVEDTSKHVFNKQPNIAAKSVDSTSQTKDEIEVKKIPDKFSSDTDVSSYKTRGLSGQDEEVLTVHGDANTPKETELNASGKASKASKLLGEPSSMHFIAQQNSVLQLTTRAKVEKTPPEPKLTQETLKQLETLTSVSSLSGPNKLETSSVAGSVSGRSTANVLSRHPLYKKLMKSKANSVADAEAQNAAAAADAEAQKAADAEMLGSATGTSWKRWLESNVGDMSDADMKRIILSLLKDSITSRLLLGKAINEKLGRCASETAIQWLAEYYSFSADQAAKAVHFLRTNGVLFIAEAEIVNAAPETPQNAEVSRVQNAVKGEDEEENMFLVEKNADMLGFLNNWSSWIASHAPKVNPSMINRYCVRLLYKAKLTTPEQLANRVQTEADILSQQSQDNPNGLSFNYLDADEIIMALIDSGLLMKIPVSAKRHSVHSKLRIVSNNTGLVSRKERNMPTVSESDMRRLDADAASGNGAVLGMVAAPRRASALLGKTELPSANVLSEALMTSKLQMVSERQSLETDAPALSKKTRQASIIGGSKILGIASVTTSSALNAKPVRRASALGTPLQAQSVLQMPEGEPAISALSRFDSIKALASVVAQVNLNPPVMRRRSQFGEQAKADAGTIESSGLLATGNDSKMGARGTLPPTNDKLHDSSEFDEALLLLNSLPSYENII